MTLFHTPLFLANIVRNYDVEFAFDPSFDVRMGRSATTRCARTSRGGSWHAVTLPCRLSAYPNNKNKSL